MSLYEVSLWYPRQTGRRSSATVRRPENVQGRRQTWTQREKKSQKITNLNKAAFLLRSYCVLTATCAIIPCSHSAPTTTSPCIWRFLWDLWAWQRRSQAIPRRSHHDHGVLHHASSTCIANARRPPGVSTTFSRRLYIKRIKIFGNHYAVILHNKHLV